MKIQLMKRGMRAAGAIIASVLLLTAACSRIDPVPKQSAAPLPKDEKEAPALRTKEVFDREKYKGLLTVRYLHLKDAKVFTGDCILITSPDGKSMLIDSGIAETGWQIVTYLDQLGIQTLDIALNTHPHADHIGGYADVLRSKDVKAFYNENFPYTNSSFYNNAMTQVERKKIPHRTLEEGDTFELGNEVKFEVFSPKKGVLPDAIKKVDADTLNYYSLVIKMTYKNNSFLFTGDIYKNKEAELIALYGKKLDSDFVHAPHHGSASSSSLAFVDAVTPKVTVLSSNIFNSLEVLQRYEKKNSDVYSTGLNGNVLITSDGKSLNVIAEKDRVVTKRPDAP